MALHDQRPPRERGSHCASTCSGAATQELAAERELAELERKMASPAGAGTEDTTLDRYAPAQARLEARGATCGAIARP